MKNLIKVISLWIIAVLILPACSELTKEVEKKINELQDKTESIDSLLNDELDKILSLDSLINTEEIKLKRLDSLIHETSSKFDSISNEKIKMIEKLTK
jgi:chromosome segregation ATPase